jgi:cell division protein FtsN
MTRDYARYSTYRTTRRPRHHRLWILFGLTLSVLMLGVGLLYVSVQDRQKVTQPTNDKLPKKIVEIPAPKPPEPKFDFYNILPQGNLALSSQANDALTLSAASDVSTVSHLNKPLEDMLSTTPEQVAIAEAKKQLEQEMNQLSNETYFLVLGDFPNASQAEQYQAKALLRGFSAHSKVGTINGKTSYRLFLGPYSEQKLALQAQKRLNAAGMPAVLVKSKQ